MEQIRIGNVSLPETSRDKYSCWEDTLDVQRDMISGRRVIETRGKVWKASYRYDYMGNDLLRKALAVLRSGAPFIATVLPDNSDQTVTSTFVVESMTQPSMAFSRRKGDAEAAFWHNISFVLREETPHRR